MYTHHLPNGSIDKNITMKEFVSIMALACLQITYSSAPPYERHLHIPQDQEESINSSGPLPDSINVDKDLSNISNIVDSPSATAQIRTHTSSRSTRKRLFDNVHMSLSANVKVD